MASDAAVSRRLCGVIVRPRAAVAASKLSRRIAVPPALSASTIVLPEPGQATNALHPIDGLDDGLALQHVQGGDRILKMSQLGAA